MNTYEQDARTLREAIAAMAHDKPHGATCTCLKAKAAAALDRLEAAAWARVVTGRAA